MQQVDLLAIAAHPDDIELTSSGTLMKMIDAGYSVGMLDLTAGEMGTRGTPELRAEEAEAARRAIGALFRANLNLGDSPPDGFDRESHGCRTGDPRHQAPDGDSPLLGRAPSGPLHGGRTRLRSVLCRGSEEGRSRRPTPQTAQDRVLHNLLGCAAIVLPSTSAATSKRKLEAIHCFQSQFKGDMSEVEKVYPAWARLVDRIRTQCRFLRPPDRRGIRRTVCGQGSCRRR